jgi:microcystin-dependent protein
MDRYNYNFNSSRYTAQRAIVNSKLIYLNQFITPRGTREDNEFSTTENAKWYGDFDILSNAEVSIQSANNQNIKLKVTGTGYVNVEGRLIADEYYQRHPVGSFSLLVPTGSISAYAGSSAPGGWMICDGSAISRTTYATLYAIIGDTYGGDNVNNTFNLPNLRGRVVVGIDSSQTEFNSLGETGGEKTHTLTIAEMPAHTHNSIVQNGVQIAGPDLGPDVSAADEPTTTAATSSTGGDGAHNNLQPYMALYYIIKV